MAESVFTTFILTTQAAAMGVEVVRSLRFCIQCHGTTVDADAVSESQGGAHFFSSPVAAAVLWNWKDQNQHQNISTTTATQKVLQRQLQRRDSCL